MPKRINNFDRENQERLYWKVTLKANIKGTGFDPKTAHYIIKWNILKGARRAAKLAK
jgi:hypothetical protein